MIGNGIKKVRDERKILNSRKSEKEVGRLYKSESNRRAFRTNSLVRLNSLSQIPIYQVVQ
jgi:hypothetical protein